MKVIDLYTDIKPEVANGTPMARASENRRTTAKSDKGSYEGWIDTSFHPASWIDCTEKMCYDVIALMINAVENAVEATFAFRYGRRDVARR
jgi:hypothetical protein